MLKNNQKVGGKNKKLNSGINKKLFFQGLILFIYTFAVALMCTALFLCEIPAESTYYIMLAVVAAAAFVSGYLIAKKEKKNGLAVGLIYNLLPCVIMLGVSLILNNFTFDYRLPVTLAVILVMSAAGGIAAVNSRRKTR